METLQDYLETIPNAQHRDRLQEIVERLLQSLPEATLEIKWNHPMITHQGTFILGFSVASKHIAISPEPQILEEFRERLTAAGYAASKALFRIQWGQSVDYSLLIALLERSFEFKQGSPTFWAS